MSLAYPIAQSSSSKEGIFGSPQQQSSLPNFHGKKITPISPSFQDSDGNKLRLWKLEDTVFFASIITASGQKLILPEDKIINPVSGLCAAPTLKIICSVNFPFRLIYLKDLSSIAVYPRIVAAGKNWVPPTFPTDKTTLNHIFKNAPGHFSKKTPETVAYIAQAVSDPRNYGGSTIWGAKYYFKMMNDGTQAWAMVKNGKIISGGFNWKPMQWVETNLLKFTGGKLVPIATIEFKRSNAGFEERVQGNKLSRYYAQSNPTNPIELHATESIFSNDIGGIENQAGLIADILPELSSEWGKFHFYIPKCEQLDRKEIQQILRELARGILVHGATPWFSLHFNEEANAYPVIHPAYENTFIGHVLSTLDYYLKGILHGRVHNDTALFEWQFAERRNYHRRNSIIDLQKYCLENFDVEFLTFREALSKIAADDPGYSTEHHPFTWGNYRISFRIIGKQNEIKKTGSLFIAEGNFDIEYTIEGDPPDEQKKHRERIEKAVVLMCKQMKDILPRLPGLKKLFEAFEVANFFTYYFYTLKAASRVPIFERGFNSVVHKDFIPLYPPLVIDNDHLITLDPIVLLQSVSKGTFHKMMTSNDSNWSREKLAGILQTYFSSQNINHEQTKGIAKVLLPLFKKKYVVTKKGILLVVNTIIRLAKLQQNASVGEAIVALDGLLELLNADEKVAFTEDKRVLEAWDSNPAAITFKYTKFLIDLDKRSIEITKEQKNIPLIAGGCGLEITKIQSQWDSTCSEVFNRYSQSLQKLDNEQFLDVDISNLSGKVFTLHWGIAGNGEDQEAIISAYLNHCLENKTLDSNSAKAFYAIETRNISLFSEVADDVENWSVANYAGVTLVHAAATTIDSYFLETIVEQAKGLLWWSKVDWSKTDANRYLPQHYAAQYRNAMALKLLHEISPRNVDATTQNGETALYIAAQEGTLGCVEACIKANADLNIRATNGMCALTTAMHHDHEEIAVALLKQRNQIQVPREAPILAVQMKMFEALELIIDRGTNINTVSSDGYTPLHIAVKLGWKKGVKALVETLGIDINATSHWNKTALDYAIETNKYEIGEFLIENRAISKKGYWISWFRVYNAGSFLWRKIWNNRDLG